MQRQTQTHAHTETQILKLVHTEIDTNTHTQKHTERKTYTQTHKHMHTPRNMHIESHAHKHKIYRLQKQTGTKRHRHTQIHVCTQTYTQTRALFPNCPSKLRAQWSQGPGCFLEASTCHPSWERLRHNPGAQPRILHLHLSLPQTFTHPGPPLGLLGPCGALTQPAFGADGKSFPPPQQFPLCSVLWLPDMKLKSSPQEKGL